MSNEIIVLSKEELKVLVKEAVAEALAINAEKVADLAEPIKEVEKKVEIKKEKKATKAEGKVVEMKKSKTEEVAEEVAEEVEEDNEEVSDDAREEIESLSYNDLKKKCKELGISAVGKRDALVERILEALEGSESEEEVEESNNTKEDKKPATGAKKGQKKATEEEVVEDDEDDSEDEEAEEFIESLSEEQILEIVGDLKKDDLLAIIEEMGEELPKYTKKKAVDMIVNGGEKTIDALVLLGYVDSDEEEEVEVEEGEEEVSLADDLAELDHEELAEICAEYDLSVKGKKQALIDRIVKAVEDGIIEEEDLFEDDEDAEEDNVVDADYEEVEEDDNAEEDADDEEEEDDWYSKEELEEFETDELEEIANENDIEIPTKKVKKGKKTTTVTDRDALIEAILALGEEEEEVDEEEDDEEEATEYEPSEERLEKEEEIEKDIRAKYKSKKLKDTAIKNFLVKYNEGNPDFKYSDLSKKEALEQYIEAKVGLVDDEGYVIDPEECYLRNNEYHCCGKQLKTKGNSFYCEVCGNEFEE